MDRRGATSFLALSSLLAGLGTGDGGDGTDPGRSGGPGRPASTDSGLPAHDHATTDAGGATLRPDDLVTAETPVVDVRAYGAVGDGETDDAAALQAAADAATPRGVLYVPADRTLALTDSVEIDLAAGEESSRFSFVCEGALKPAAGLGEAIHSRAGLRRSATRPT